MKKNILNYALMCVMALSLAGCDDFFMVETDNVLDDEEYIKAPSEMYSGFIGIFTKMQAIGDKAIYLTDTRAEALEPTRNSPSELYNLYNYETDLRGNSYADPAGYYDLIIACNDYLYKLLAYKEANKESIDMDHYRAFISATVRVKAWTYLTIAKIYGEAIWFDEPLRETADLSKYPLQDIRQVVKSCIALLDNGFDGVPSNVGMFNWAEWVDPEGYKEQKSDNEYMYWSYMAPPYFVLYAELCLWDEQYQKTVDLILAAMNEKVLEPVDGTRKNQLTWLRNNYVGTRYGVNGDYFAAAKPYNYETVSVIIYSYQKNQTNSMLKHFGTQSPNEYLLAPSEVAVNRFNDPEFNNLALKDSDPRGNGAFGKVNGDYVVRKYRAIGSTARVNAYQDDVHIYTYRGCELYFFLAEALNNLGRFDEASTLINQGLSVAFPKGGVTWDGFNDDWTPVITSGPPTDKNRVNRDLGVRGSHGLGDRPFNKDKEDPEAIKFNDFAIMDEMLLEFPCEGRTLPAMVRVALRHNDFSQLISRVTEKYDNPGDIAAKIQAGGYFIKWDMTE